MLKWSTGDQALRAVTMAILPITQTSHHDFVLFDGTRQRYYNVDALAALVWNLIQRPMTLVEIRDAVLERFEMEPDTAEQYIVGLLDEMETKGLIEKAG